MLFNLIGSVLNQTGISDTLSALRSNPSGWHHVGEALYAKEAERHFVPLGVLLASAQRYIDNAPLAALGTNPAPIAAATITDMASITSTAKGQSIASKKQAMASLVTTQVASAITSREPAYFDSSAPRWRELFVQDGLMAVLVPLSAQGRGAVYEVLEQLGKAAHHLSEAQQDQSSKPRTVFAPAHRFVADGPSPRDIRRASVEEVFGTLMREAQNNVDARALVFNLTTLLGEPEGWPAEQVALFDRVLQQCAVSEADVAAMRTMQAGYRQSLGAVQAVFAGGARPTPTSQE